ncbi:hypothetical protein [Hymenobacter chitinivorans]|uniref:Carboxypeptidase family protein n=1 Tax=Hymenobacter chitinivorans DSM 11115 TaxID=1121954 RepID=A0A2M9BLQ0_9BACT|nr:hypothetical protein [Hymenobacter chitinivorans]PJJ58862.1 hypothetical protein CLV45_0273 [Hymenobacter chitinivorans DSM 11115]
MSNSRIYFAIPEPCHQDWAQMTPTERGRFCQACRKEVLDFSATDPTTILSILRHAPEGSVCGRIPTQVLAQSRQQAETAARRPHWPGLSGVRRWLAAVSVPLLAVTTPLLAHPVAVPHAVAPGASSRPTTLQLRVYDPATGQGVGFATVQLWLANSLLLTAQAEADGTLQLALPDKTDTLRLLVQMPGFRAAEEQLQPGTVRGPLAIPLQRGATELPVVRKAAEAPVQQRTILGGAISTYVVVEQAPLQRLTRTPKRLFEWLRRKAKPEQ